MKTQQVLFMVLAVVVGLFIWNYIQKMQQKSYDYDYDYQQANPETL